MVGVAAKRAWKICRIKTLGGMGAHRLRRRRRGDAEHAKSNACRAKDESDKDAWVEDSGFESGMQSH
jgi:hypothetical protein